MADLLGSSFVWVTIIAVPILGFFLLRFANRHSNRVAAQYRIARTPIPSLHEIEAALRERGASATPAEVAAIQNTLIAQRNDAALSLGAEALGLYLLHRAG